MLELYRDRKEILLVIIPTAIVPFLQMVLSDLCLQGRGGCGAMSPHRGFRAFLLLLAEEVGVEEQIDRRDHALSESECWGSCPRRICGLQYPTRLTQLYWHPDKMERTFFDTTFEKPWAVHSTALNRPY